MMTPEQLDALLERLDGRWAHTSEDDAVQDPDCQDAFTAITELREELAKKIVTNSGLALMHVESLDRAEVAEKERDKMRKAIEFFLEDGIAEDSPDLNQFAYASLTASITVTEIKEPVDKDEKEVYQQLGRANIKAGIARFDAIQSESRAKDAEKERDKLRETVLDLQDVVNTYESERQKSLHRAEIAEKDRDDFKMMHEKGEELLNRYIKKTVDAEDRVINAEKRQTELKNDIVDAAAGEATAYDKITYDKLAYDKILARAESAERSRSIYRSKLKDSEVLVKSYQDRTGIILSR